MASVVLGVIMLAVATAVGTAQQMSFESQKRLFAAIAADDFMSEVATLEYDDLAALHNRSDDIGALRTLDGRSYPLSFWSLGRTVSVLPQRMTDPDTGVAIDGRMVRVATHDAYAELAVVQLFVPEPGV